MGSLRQFTFVVLALLGLFLAMFGGFYLLGPIVLGIDLPDLLLGGSQIQATATRTGALPPTGAPSPRPLPTSVPMRTALPTASPLPTATATAAPSPTPSRTPTITASAIPTQVVSRDDSEISHTAAATAATAQETAGIVVGPTSLTVAEPQGTETFTISLSSEPMAPVTMPLGSSSDECSVSAAEVTLDNDNWRDGVTVQVAAVDDETADGDRSCVVEIGTASSTGEDYDGTIPENVTVTVEDNDVARIVVGPTSLTVAEPQGAEPLSISLSSVPMAPVTMPLGTSSDECRVSAAEVTLDSDNWREGVTVQVAAVDDETADGDQLCVVKIGAASSAGKDYDGTASENVTVTVEDDDVARIVVGPTSLTVAEPQGAGTFTISLSSKPMAPVTMPLSPSLEECLVSTGEVTLDSDNWRDGVTVQVAAVDDQVADGDQLCVVEIGTASSTREDYDEMIPASVVVIVEDDDAAGIIVGPTNLTVAEPRGSQTFTISLSSEPVAPVSVPLSLSNDECLVSPGEISLDAANWRDGVTVQVAAVDDEIADGDQLCVVDLGAASSSGNDYDHMIPASVQVTVEDDDAAGIVVGPTSLTLAEPKGSQTFTISLSSEPVAPVSVPLSPSNDECLVSPGEISLDAANWRDGVIVQVTAVDDEIADGDQPCMVEAGPTNSTGDDYDHMIPPSVQVTVEDDDAASIVSGPTNLAVAEPDGSEAFTISLSSEPTATVAISLIPDGQTAVSPTQLSFTDLNWRIPQSVTVMVSNDQVAEGQHRSTIRQIATSDDGNYAGVAPGNILVQIADDDVAGVAITPTLLQVLEGGPPQRYEIVLTSQPTATVIISLASDVQITASPSPLTFTELNWSVPQAVAVTAEEDGAPEEVQTSIIRHTLSSDDRGYADLAISDVTATVMDSDAPGGVVTSTGTITGSRLAEAEGEPATSESPNIFSGFKLERIRISPVLVIVVVIAIVAAVLELMFGRRRR